MTEEIIIDGVDVAGCVRLQDDKISCDLGGECKGWENCYYKQLKRLEQENKELKDRVKAEIHLGNNYKKDFAEQVTIAEKYRSALEEINTLAKNYCNACDEFKVKTYKNKNDCFYCNYGFIKRKINEVLNHSEG